MDFFTSCISLFFHLRRYYKPERNHVQHLLEEQVEVN